MTYKKQVQPDISRMMWAVFSRDFRLAWRQGGAGALTVGFFVMCLSLFPFGLGSDVILLARVGSALVWISALFAAILSLDRLFQTDFEDGSMAQGFLSPLSPLLWVMAKITAHWMASLMPLVMLGPVVAIFFALPEAEAYSLFWSLLIGTPALSLIGGLAASLTVAVKRGGVLITLLVLPLFVPTLIFGVGMVEAVRVNLLGSPAGLYLAIVTLVAALVAPVFSVLALKIAME